jgi:hypothetical protein
VKTLSNDERASVQFDASSRRLAVWSSTQSVEVWILGDTARRPTVFGTGGESVAQVAFSPDGKWLALGGHGLWVANVDASPGVLVAAQRLTGPPFENTAVSVAFRPDSRQVAMLTGSSVKTRQASIAAWDFDTFEAGGDLSLLAVVDDIVKGQLRYQGDLLLAINEANKIKAAWPASAAALRDQARRHGGRNLRVDESRMALAGRYRPTFAELPSLTREDVESVLWTGLEAPAYRDLIAPAMDHDDPRVLLSLCACGARSGLADAQQVCARLAEIEPAATWSLDAHAMALALAGNRARAIEVFQAVVALARARGDDAFAVERRGWINRLARGERREPHQGLSRGR